MSDKITIDTRTYYDWLKKNPDNLSHIYYEINNSYIHYIKENNLNLSRKSYIDFVQIRNENYDLNILNFDDYFYIVDYIPEINEFYNWNNKHINLKKYAECIFEIINKREGIFSKAYLLDVFAYYDTFHSFILDDYNIHSEADLDNYFNFD